MPLAQLLKLLLLQVTAAQLEIQIRRYQQVEWNFEPNNADRYSVVAEYSFPSGFSTDWFITSHANIPAQGITGFLYQPQPKNGCSSFSNTSYTDCSMTQLLNVSKISLLDDYHLCTRQKILSSQQASFDAIVTYSPGDMSIAVGQSVWDRSLNEPVDINSSGVPLAVVSEEFYSKLRVMATTSNCSAENIALVSLRVGAKNVGTVRSALIAFFVLCGLIATSLVLLCCFFMYLSCEKLFRRKRGRYNVHEHQTHELGVLGDRNTPRGAHILPYIPEEWDFHRTEGDTDTQCPICLEDFAEGERITALACDRNHAFHPKCIDKWLNSQSTCPVCRTSIYT